MGTELERLMEKLEELSVVIGLLSDVTGTGLIPGLQKMNGGISKIRKNLNGLQKGTITVIAGFAEFAVISDTVKGLVDGSENLVVGIGKIGAVAGIAGAAMYTALGPAGIAIAAITGLVAAVAGVKTAIDNMIDERLGEDMKDRFGEITLSLANAVGPAVYTAVASAMENKQNETIRVFIGDREITEVAIEGINERTRKTGVTPINLAF